MPYSSDFKKLIRKIRKTYFGMRVPKKHRKEFGLYYDEDEILPLSFAIANSRGIKIN